MPLTQKDFHLLYSRGTEGPFEFRGKVAATGKKSGSSGSSGDWFSETVSSLDYLPIV